MYWEPLSRALAPCDDPLWCYAARCDATDPESGMVAQVGRPLVQLRETSLSRRAVDYSALTRQLPPLEQLPTTLPSLSPPSPSSAQYAPGTGWVQYPLEILCAGIRCRPAYLSAIACRRSSPTAADHAWRVARYIGYEMHFRHHGATARSNSAARHGPGQRSGEPIPRVLCGR